MKVAYILVVATILYLFASFGFILPFLISAPSTILVVLGVAYIISMPVVLYRVYQVFYKAFNKPTTKENEIEIS